MQDKCGLSGGAHSIFLGCSNFTYFPSKEVGFWTIQKRQIFCLLQPSFLQSNGPPFLTGTFPGMRSLRRKDTAVSEKNRNDSSQESWNREDKTHTMSSEPLCADVQTEESWSHLAWSHWRYYYTSAEQLRVHAVSHNSLSLIGLHCFLCFFQSSFWQSFE